MKKFLNIKDILQEIKPFDIIFFKGTDFVSKTIIDIEVFVELHKTDKFSHVGMVLNHDVLPIPQLEKGKWYIWESTCSYSFNGLFDKQPNNIITNTSYFGVQVRELEDVVKCYLQEEGAEVAWGKLIHNPWHQDNHKYVRKRLLKLFKENDLKTYNYDIFDLLGAAFPCMRSINRLFYEIDVGNRKILSLVTNKIKPETYYQSQTKLLFCSELVALILRAFKVIPKTIEPWDVTPMDLLGERNMETVVHEPIYFKI